MPSLREMQKEHKVWMEHNFPDETYQQALMGMVEEMGELAHVVLKEEQGIRAIDGDNSFNLKCDALADLIIFSFGFCNLSNIDLQEALESTWDRVKKRDWIADPEKGGET